MAKTIRALRDGIELMLDGAFRKIDAVGDEAGYDRLDVLHTLLEALAEWGFLETEEEIGLLMGKLLPRAIRTIYDEAPEFLDDLGFPIEKEKEEDKEAIEA